MKRHPVLSFAFALTLLAAGCGRQVDDSPLSVSVIGGRLRPVDPNAGPLDPVASVLIGATAQGLVRYDASGQIEPGLAIRWAISDDGLYYTFRLADTDGMDAEFVARRLRNVIARRSANSLKPILGAIDEIVAVTPAVVEIRLKAPRPNFLDLLAQPEMAIIDKAVASGPFVLASGNERRVTLHPVATGGDVEPPSADELRRRSILLHGERASLAVARYAAGMADLVLGGRLVDLGLVQAAKLPARDLRIDPVSGLFGLAAVERGGVAGNSENRRALAMAIDRDRIATAFNAPGLQPVTSLVAPGTTELPQPAQPGWSANALPARRTAAATIVRVWKLSHPDAQAKVRVALPERPGSRLLFALLRSDWAAIGVEAEQVGMSANANLRLIDEVAPAQTATWYLRHFNCERNAVCSEAADAALEIARDTLHPVERAARIADADLRLAELVPYIPLAQPLRWSLVNARVTGFATNNRGVHPLNHLIEDPR
jgi:peptide/nickel transport system substrate-binding protein